MTVEFNHEAVMKEFKKKQKKFLTKTGFMGVVLAATNSRFAVGTSQLAKTFSFKHPESKAEKTDTIYIEAPLNYDLYLEKRYGILAKTQDQLIPYMVKFEEEIFG